ncbi:MAG: DUF1549 and DUF1553 domain-containing protein, partial [Chthonomonadaceae bacterium]|nr:DUF1549 and DUF1553 domain-containing protein [Chthonomonadaceae bacterium]
TPIDAFILARLEAKGLRPAPEADRRTLIRRAYYDLLGLPPTPEEVEGFVRDRAADAWERVVDRLLASPHYGERWARHWLDLVRYAETDGHEFDFEKPGAFEYRDYVIRAFNADVPYDQFVREHIAGDLLPRPRLHPQEKFNESLIGTAFWWLGEGKHSPVDLRVDEAERVDNQIDVFGKAFLAQTIACARCHDHKFDAISTQDYYALSGFLKGSRYQVADLTPPERLQPIVQELSAATDALRKEFLQDATARLQAALPTLIAAGDGPRTASLPAELQGLQGLRGAEQDPEDPFHALAILSTEEARRSPQAFATRRDALIQQMHARTEEARRARAGVTVFETFNGSRFDRWYVSGQAFGERPVASALRWSREGHLLAVFGNGLADSGHLAAPLRGALRSRTFRIRRNFVLYRAAGKGGQIRLIIDNFQRIMAPIYGGLAMEVNTPERMTWFAMDVSKWVGHRAYIELLDSGPGHLCVDEIVFADVPRLPGTPNPLVVRMLADTMPDSATALAQQYARLLEQALQQWRTGSGDPGAPARLELIHAALKWLSGAPNNGKTAPVNLTGLLERYHRLEARIPPARPVIAAADGTGENDRVHLRGNPKTLGAVVPRRFLQVFTTSERSVPHTVTSDCGRLELAERLLTGAAPLLARVMVNRLWHHHFGAGIVRTTDDFGLMGERPTHPELLDYLAARFIQQGWSLKRMHRMMLLSSTYRMQSRSSARAAQVDPQNRLWHRANLRRLEAEAIRDAVLAISGRLDRTLYGPSVMPHLTEFMEGRGRPKTSGPLDGNGRRSIYIGVRRNFLTPFFLAFDYPVPFSTMGRR